MRVLLPCSGMAAASGAPEVTALLATDRGLLGVLNRAREVLGLSQLDFVALSPAPSGAAHDHGPEVGGGGAGTESVPTFDNMCMGGTFDRIHAGHKLLLTMAALCTNRRLVIGVTDYSGDTSLSTKTLPELMQPVHTRIVATLQFLQSVKPTLEYDVVPITGARTCCALVAHIVCACCSHAVHLHAHAPPLPLPFWRWTPTPTPPQPARSLPSQRPPLRTNIHI